MTRRAAVAATSPLAAQAGLDIVHDGGNAVDGAIAAMTVAMATEPSVVSPLGGAFVNVWPHDGPPMVIDGNVEMPGRGLSRERFGTGFREIETTYGGGMTVYAGHASVATPGTFAALGVAHDLFGAAPWAALMGPAVSAARNGFPLGKTSADYLALTHDTVYGWDEQTRAFLTTPDGTPYPTGAILRSADLANALEAVGTRGWGDLYTGDLAEQIAVDMEQRGGLVTRADLAGYRAAVREPLMSSLADWQVAANAPPSIGGPVLTAMLLLLAARAEGAGRAGRAHRTPSDLIEIQRHVLGYRHGHLDASQDLMASGHELVELVRTRGMAGLSTSASTAHISVVDSDGLACAITASSGYGSGATVPGTGLQLNNSLGEPELNRLGMHTLPPGTRLASNMTPTTARRRGGSLLAIGSPGADRITTALMQVLAAVCLDGTDLQEAVDGPRLHVRYLADGSAQVDHEDDAALLDAVRECGLPARVFGHRDMLFGGVGAASVGPGGELAAAADGRREAATAIG